jgi:hypothetical protein
MVVIDPARPAEVKAAEYFRTLTDVAFTADPPRLDASIRNAEAAVAPLRPSLAPEVVTALDVLLAQMHAARAAMDRPRIAFASAEAYHVLASSIPDTARIPRAVYLIGYAALRYDADLKSRPTRWADMIDAAALAGHTWALLKPEVEEDALRRRTDESVTQMATAAAVQDQAAARAAAQAVLHRVAELETYYTNHARPQT